MKDIGETKFNEKSGNIPDVCPLTRIQLDVYLDCIRKTDSVAYNCPTMMKLPAGTDKERFIRAVKDVAEKHKVLFTTIGTPGGVPSMIYNKQEVNVNENTAESTEEFFNSHQRPFDLEKGPLYRFDYVSSPNGDAFVMDVHHIIFDGTSINRFVRQIADVYNGAECPEEEVTLFDIAMNEKDFNDPDNEKKYLDYFDSEFGGVDCDSKPVPDRMEKGDFPKCGHISVDTDDLFSSDEITAYVQANKISENALFLGSFGYALAKFNGADHSVFNTANHGRDDRRLSETFGMFVRTVPMICKFDENESPSDYLLRVYNNYFISKKNKYIPYDKLAELYGLNMNISFIYQAELFNDVDLDCGKCEVKVKIPDSSVSDIEFMLMKTKTGYTIECQYLRSDYTGDFAQSFINMFINTVRGMIKAATLKEISFVDSESIKKLEALNRTEQEYDSSKTVIDLFREQVKKTPDNICISYNGRNYTYKETDEYTDRMAKYLVTCGLDREEVCAVLVPRSEYITLCSVAVLKAGGAYLPMDTSYPPERLNLMVQDSGAVMLVTTGEFNGLINDDFTGMRIILEETVFDDSDVELPSSEPTDLFCMIYTSGSTGLPKGVMYNHSNVVVTEEFFKRYFDINSASKVVSYASYGFDANMADTYPVITSGATLHIISEDIRLDLLAVRDYFNTNGITHAVMTTQVGRQFALLGGFKTLKHLSVAGEKLAALDPPEGFRMYNLYGPTEGSVITSSFYIDGSYRDIPIGKAVDNLKLHIVDKTGRLLPTGAVGELWISGPHVTRGYLNRPEKTAEAYGTNPFCHEKGYDRVYRTGDIVRLAADGNLQFIGRRDGMVKIRGFRVELKEVEEVILRFNGIKDATVVAFDDKNGGKYLAAYIVSNNEIDIDELNAFIRSEKPPYMVPAVTMQIDKIPLNQNHKVNKKALPVPVRKAENVILPENEVQQKIYDIVADIIGHNDFGIDTDFYSAGLTSIGMLEFNVRLGTEFDVPVKLDDIIQNNTVRKIEPILSSSEKQTGYEIYDDYPITQTQKGIFIECSMNSNTVMYNMPMLIKLDGNVDIPKLVSALKTIINAHPYIKTTLYPDTNGDVRARRNDSDEPQIDEIICEKVPAENELVVPFDLIGGNLYRTVIYKTGDGNYLFMDFHHIIADGVSEIIFLSDLDKAYSGNSVQIEKYTGFEAALSEKEDRASDRLGKAKAYYDSIFKGCEADSLPKKAPEKNKKGAAAVKRICKVDAGKISYFCEKNSFTQNAFFNSAFGFTLSRFGQADDSVFCTIYNGRNDSRLASSVTMLVKTLPVLINTDKSRAIIEIINETQDQLMNSMANDIFSFAEISAEYGIHSDIIFVYQGENFNFDSICGAPAEFINVLPSVAKAPITVNVYLKNGRYEFDAEYRCEMFNEAFINSLLDVFECVLNGFTEKKTTDEINILSDSAEKKLCEINDTKRDFENIPVNRFVERIAASNPDKVAVIDTNSKLTFKELNSLSNRIAHVLIEHGVKKDSIVGMMLERTAMLSVVELAIIKAGGAFLGLLPEYPDDRVEYCLNDAKSIVVITTEEIKSKRTSLFGDDRQYITLTIEEMLGKENDENPDLDISPDSLVYCIYTSGSTGTPKGVMIEHHSLANCAQPSDFPYEYYHGVKSGKTGLALSSISFDMSVFDNLLLLMNGITVCIASNREIHNPNLLAELMTNNNVDTMACTPSFLTNLIRIPEMLPAVKNLKTIVSGAEAFPEKLYDEIKKISPDIVILNGYGPSECTMTCCAKSLDGSGAITIGGPSANTTFYVVDSFCNILPPYACGELIICGELVGRGYVGLPEKTKASFFKLNGLPAYHSGDMVRLNEDGEVEFFGRKDNQVKLRGFRIELDEIENAINSYPGVLTSKVLVKGEETNQFLTAWFTASCEIDPSDIQAEIGKTLTHYMVPRVFIQIPAMPLTANGKIDKAKLPELDYTQPDRPYIAPANAVEKDFCDLFGDILGIERVSSEDNFFELGGTSLSASRIAMFALEKGYQVVYADVFKSPTPKGLASLVFGTQENIPTNEPDITEYDYSRLDGVLAANIPENLNEIKLGDPGNVLITGATGFLAIHVLWQYLKTCSGTAYCLLRKGRASSVEARLRMMLVYYFSDSFDQYFESGRIRCIEGDITNPNSLKQLDGAEFDTLINCAALVKHFDAEDQLDTINVQGVKNLIDCCLGRNRRLIQISTVSIAGETVNGVPESGKLIHENELFFGQLIENDYIRTKFCAERAVLEGITKGLDAKIMRVGNLMGRDNDGEFQINFRSNGFMRQLRGYKILGAFPITLMNAPAEFSEISKTAEAILRLSATDSKFTVFHPCNNHLVTMADVIDIMQQNGMKIDIVSEEDFRQKLNEAAQNPDISEDISGLIAYMNNDSCENRCLIDASLSYTTEALFRTGFKWPITSPKYLNQFIAALDGLGMFS